MVGAGVLYDFLGGRGGGVGPHSQGGRELEGVGVVERGRNTGTNVGVGPSAVLQEPQNGIFGRSGRVGWCWLSRWGEAWDTVDFQML